MANIASLLKSEIIRLSKKVVREQTNSMRSATTAHRHQIAALKKQLQLLERDVAKLRSRSTTTKATAVTKAESPSKNRFVAKGLKSLRVRLGLSAADFGRLVGVGGQTIYNWEAKKTTPNTSQVAVIARLRGLGKRDIRERLASGE